MLLALVTVVVLVVPRDESVLTLTGHTSYVSAVALAQLDGRPVIVSGSDDATVRTWDLTARAGS